MARKRKRSRATGVESDPASKRSKRDDVANDPLLNGAWIQHPTLSLYFPNILSLRAYLFSRLSSSASKARIRKVVGVRGVTAIHGSKQDIGDGGPLADLLDKTLVCFHGLIKPEHCETLERDFADFSQQSALTPGSSLTEGTTPQFEVSQ